MGDERFSFDLNGDLWDTVRGIAYCDKGSICDLLNGLCDENEKLQFKLDECINNKLYSRRELERENKQLRKENAELDKKLFFHRLELLNIEERLH